MSHTRAQIRSKNAEWIDANLRGADPGMYKYAKESAESYIRTMMMEDAITDDILPPEQISAEDCDRTLTSLKPYKIVEVEPEATGAVTVQYGTNPNTVILEGKRIPVFFNKIITDKYTKDIDELRMWDMDIRQIVCDKQTKWMQWEVDRRFIWAANSALSMHAEFPSTNLPCLWRTYADGFTRENYVDSLRIMFQSRSRFHPDRLLMNEFTAYEVFKWGHEEMGGPYSQELITEGKLNRDMMGKKWTVTMKRELVPDGRVYMFAEPKFLGRNYILQPVTMYVENEATKISWYMYETRGGCLANVTAIACADFNCKGTINSEPVKINVEDGTDIQRKWNDNGIQIISNDGKHMYTDDDPSKTQLYNADGSTYTG